jgi:hypothetical protein
MEIKINQACDLGELLLVTVCPVFTGWDMAFEFKYGYRLVSEGNSEELGTPDPALCFTRVGFVILSYNLNCTWATTVFES